MKTRGTANLDLLADGELKHLLAACCLDVYEGAVLGDEELEFALGTLDRFMAERHRRIAATRPVLSIGDTAPADLEALDAPAMIEHDDDSTCPGRAKCDGRCTRCCYCGIGPEPCGG